MISNNMSILKQLGITMPETLIVMLISGIIAAMAIPSFTKMLERRKLITAAEAIESDLHWARGEAIKRNTDVTVTFTSGNGGAWSYTIDPSSKTVDSAAINEFNDIALTNNFTGSNTKFDHIRGMANKAGTVTLTSNSNMALKVTVSLIGRARICSDEPSIKGYSAC
jgi:Tfp pilus assembly protein FimT